MSWSLACEHAGHSWRWFFDEGYKGQYDLPLPFTFTRLNINNSTTYDLIFDIQNESYPHFEINPLPWYYIDYPKWGYVFLIRNPSIQPWGVKMIVFSTQMKSYIFSNLNICVRFVGFGQMKTYILISGWWIYCDNHLVKMH